MKTLVVGASGATGRQLVEQLLELEQDVKVIVRSPDKIPESWKNNKHVSIIQASILEINQNEMLEMVKDCHAVASCLGHNMSLKGVFGKPRKLVTDSVRLLCDAIKSDKANKSVKFLLMNTAGNRNRDLNEPVSTAQKIVLGLIRLLIPPQADNEKAADFLRTEIGQQDSSVEWVVVRPDSLVNEALVCEYQVHSSPIRSAIFNPGKTSRINVGHFMASLLTDKDSWNKWKGQMPVIYNKTS